MKARHPLEVYVLAGGRSSRMGQEKGLVLLKDRPLVTYVLSTLEKCALPIRIIAHHPGYQNFGYPVVPDAVKEKGPMGGLLTALTHTRAERILLVSCDMPLISVAVINMLTRFKEREGIIAVETDDRINPLLAIYPTSLKPKLEQSIEEERLKMSVFVSENKHTLVSSSSLKMPWCFLNINDNNELKKTEEKWGHLL